MRFQKSFTLFTFTFLDKFKDTFFWKIFFLITTFWHFIQVFLVLFQKISTVSTGIDHYTLFFSLEISIKLTFLVQKNAFLSLWRPALLQKSQLGTKKFLFSGSNQKVLSGRINNNIKSNLKKQLLLCKNSIFWNFHKFLKRYNFLILNNLVVSLPNMYLSYLKMIVRAQGM